MRKKQILDHLEQLVAFYPCSQDQASVMRALQYVQAVLDATGCFADTTIHDSSGVYSLTASTQGTKQPRFLMQGHIDVVPACSETQQKLHVSGDTVAGRGVYDMLFAAACYLTFVQAHTADLPGLDLGLMLTGDEEIGGFQGTEYLLDQGFGCEVCVIPDAGNDFGDLSVSAKGIYNFDVIICGKAHHGARPWEGDGAGNKLIRALTELMAAFDDSSHDNSTLTITGLTAGQATNQGPETATAHLDIRYKDAADFKRIKQAVADLCAKYTAKTRHVVICDNLQLDRRDPYIQEFAQLYVKYAGTAVTYSNAHGGSDARFFASRGMPVIMLRPDGEGAHAERESLSVSSLEKFYLLLEEYTLKTAKISQ